MGTLSPLVAFFRRDYAVDLGHGDAQLQQAFEAGLAKEASSGKRNKIFGNTTNSIFVSID
jgi:hypothetical protein